MPTTEPRGPAVPTELRPGPPTLKSSLRHTRMVQPLRWKSSEGPLGSVFPGVGSPAPDPLLRATPPTDDRTLHRVALWALGCVPGYGVTGKKSGDTSLGYLFWHIPLESTVQAVVAA